MLYFPFVIKITSFNITRYVNINPKTPIITFWPRHCLHTMQNYHEQLPTLVVSISAIVVPIPTVSPTSEGTIQLHSTYIRWIIWKDNILW